MRAELTVVVSGLLLVGLVFDRAQGAPPTAQQVFGKNNLVAWCIVPFDAQQRNPQQRAEMLNRLGIKRVAYDWREPHVPTFEAEILAYREHGLEYFAFWDVHEQAFALFEQYQLHPQIWKIIPMPQTADPAQMVESAARQLLPLVERTRQLGCRLGLYNHGGWTGQPENMVAVCRWLRTNAQADHVGLVYNFHHGHEHLGYMREALVAMKPFLLCVNINGMNDNAQPKILPVGQGTHDVKMLQTLLDLGYNGPIGILNHREEVDAEVGLRQNLQGLDELVPRLK